MPQTYNLIATANVGGTTAGTFSSISQSYTDLVIVCNTRVTSVWDLQAFQVNGAGSSYDQIYSESTGMTSGNGTAQIAFRVNYIPGTSYPSTVWDTSIYHLLNYSQGNTYKTLLTQGGAPVNGAFFTQNTVSTYTGATTAMTSLVYGTANGSTYAANSVIRLYGILAA
jgi:hypothetical protein